MTKKLLLIGWDAADWKTIDRLVDQGDMPIMRGLIERGTRGNLTALHRGAGPRGAAPRPRVVPRCKVFRHPVAGALISDILLMQ